MKYVTLFIDEITINTNTYRLRRHAIVNKLNVHKCQWQLSSIFSRRRLPMTALDITTFIFGCGGSDDLSSIIVQCVFRLDQAETSTDEVLLLYTAKQSMFTLQITRP